MLRKSYAVFGLSLLLAVTLPIATGKPLSLVPAVMAQSTDARNSEADRLLQLCHQNFDNHQTEFAIQSCQRSIKANQQIKDFRVLTIKCLLKYSCREYLTDASQP